MDNSFTLSFDSGMRLDGRVLQLLRCGIGGVRSDHFVLFGGVPLCAVFKRPKTGALKWAKNGEVTEWNPIFAHAALELGFTAEVSCYVQLFHV